MDSLIKSGANVKGWIVGQPVPDEPQLENVIRKKFIQWDWMIKLFYLVFRIIQLSY